MTKYLLLALLCVSCTSTPSVPKRLTVEGITYERIEPWRTDRLTLWESVPRNPQKQYFIVNSLSYRQGGTPIFATRQRE